MAKLTLKAVQAGHDIIVSFKDAVLQFLVRIDAGAGGSVSPSGDVLVNAGDDLVLFITPDAGKLLDKIMLDGVEVAPDAE